MLFKKFYSRQKAGCHSNQKGKKELKNLVQNYWSDLKIIWHKWSFAVSRPRLFILFKLMKKKTGRHGGRTVFPIHIYEKLQTSLLVKKSK